MFDLWQSLKDMFYGILSDIVNDWLQQLQGVVSDIIQTAFHIEKMPGLSGGILTPETVKLALSALYLTMVGILTLKLLYKGWEVYVLWRGGEAEVSPFEMLKNAVVALITAMAFPILYDIAVAISMSVSNKVLNALPGLSSGNIAMLLTGIMVPALVPQISVFTVLLMLTFVILCIILAVQMLKRGAEMLIYRLGVPFAVVGIVNSDGGAWTNYIQLFFRQLATVMIQNFCLRIAIALVATISIPNMVVGIMFLITAFTMPKLLSSVLGAGGGNGSGTMYTVMMAARAFAGG